MVARSSGLFSPEDTSATTATAIFPRRTPPPPGPTVPPLRGSIPQRRSPRRFRRAISSWFAGSLGHRNQRHVVNPRCSLNIAFRHAAHQPPHTDVAEARSGRRRPRQLNLFPVVGAVHFLGGHRFIVIGSKNKNLQPHAFTAGQ